MTTDTYDKARAFVAALAERFIPDTPAQTAQLDQGRSAVREMLTDYGVDITDPAERRAAATGVFMLGHLLLGNVPMTPDVAQLITAEMCLFAGIGE